MKQNEFSSLAYPVEQPPSLTYAVEWASAQEKAMISARLAESGRQTMNVRTMPGAKFLILRDVGQEGKIIGWQGMDYESKPGYPEKFSLHLDDEYRSFLLGLTLEHAFAIHLREMNIRFAYVRMDTFGNASLKDYRVQSGFFKQVPASELDQKWVNQCEKCELYKGSCKEQGFFEFQVAKLLEFGERRLGVANFTSLPAKVNLVAEMIRQEDGAEQRKYKAQWAA